MVAQSTHQKTGQIICKGLDTHQKVGQVICKGLDIHQEIGQIVNRGLDRALTRSDRLSTGGLDRALTRRLESMLFISLAMPRNWSMGMGMFTFWPAAPCASCSCCCRSWAVKVTGHSALVGSLHTAPASREERQRNALHSHC